MGGCVNSPCCKRSLPLLDCIRFQVQITNFLTLRKLENSFRKILESDVTLKNREFFSIFAYHLADREVCDYRAKNSFKKRTLIFKGGFGGVEGPVKFCFGSETRKQSNNREDECNG